MLGQLITKLFTGEAGVFVARMRRVLTLYAVMAAVGLLMLAFLGLALFVWLAQTYGVVQTAVGCALVCLVALVLLYIALFIVRRPPRQRASDRLQRDIASIAGVAAASNIPLMFKSVRRQKKLLLLPFGAVGLWALLRAITAFRDRDA